MGVEVGVDITVGGGIAAHVGEARAFVFTEGGGFGKGDVVYGVSNEAVCGVEGFVTVHGNEGVCVCVCVLFDV